MTTSCPSACAARTRQAQTSSPSSEHRARAALALLARVLRPGQAQPLAQREEQALARPDVRLARVAVDGERDPHAQRPLERAPRQHAQRMAPVRGRAADVVDRRSRPRRRGPGTSRPPRAAPARGPTTGPAEPYAARSSPFARSASEQTAITIALRGPTFMNVSAPPGTTRTATISSSSRERVLLRADEELLERQPPRAADARDLDLAVGDEQRRDRVSRRGRRAEVAADRGAVADLRRADGARGLRQRGQRVAERPVLDLGAGEAGAEAQASRLLAPPPAQLVHLGQVQDRLGPRCGRS